MPGRQQRRLRNYLLDKHFQLKYSAYLAGIAFVLSACLGALLWRTSVAVIAQSHATVAEGEKVVQRGQDVVKESQKVSEVVKMSIIKDPVYSENPDLLDAFKSDSDKQAGRLADQQKSLEQQASSLKQQAADIAQQQRSLLLVLTSALALLVIFIGLAGIVVTHKVAGPAHKMKRQLKDVGQGKLHVPAPLRKGDDLGDLFQAFESMVLSLRERQKGEIEKLDAAIQILESKASPGDLDDLKQLRRDMNDELDR